MRTLVLVLASAVVGGCVPEASLEEKTAAHAQIELAAVRATTLLTPAIADECAAAANTKLPDGDFKPKAPLVASAAAAKYVWSGAHSSGLYSTRPTRGGTLVVYIAPYDEIGLFGQATRGIGGCAYELVGDRLYMLEGLRRSDFVKTSVIVI
ncbi:hypothetical protein [Methylopila sp. Yamaguchi]|uniref:hypothetical protein n=1 Tax=Methylopila sp. Yamaguchi TaxID=1437817 RepID=UPI000CA8C68E|nr:hypothetical protein [Methylopila sp. Yamaguchi]GBD47340.1 hypothetical protein METY_0553 [Methylopila sp. Yamaguchi]